MLRRKIEDYLRKWKDTPDHNPLVIMGLRVYDSHPRRCQDDVVSFLAPRG